MHKFHGQYQYQFKLVDGDGIEKFSMFLSGVAWKNGRFMDDLYGALGAFAFCLALGTYRYTASATHGRLEIREVYAYMRDVFTFHDRSTEWGTQYLGHWNRTGFIVIPFSTAAGELTKSDWASFPVKKVGVISDYNVYYPVRNKEYREWQLKYKQGGDLVLYSDIQIIQFQTPKIIEFDLRTGEIK